MRITFVAVVIAAASAVHAAPASAQEPVTLDVTGGFDGHYVLGGWVPLTVNATATRAVSGTLVVRSFALNGATDVTALPIELSGGARKRFDVLVPAPSPRSPMTVRFSYDEGEAEVASTLSLAPIRREVFVGMVGAEPPAVLDGLLLQPTLAEARAVEIEPEVLSLGSESLAAIDYLVAESDAYEDMPPVHQEAITSWIDAGGRLVLTGTVEAPAGEARPLGPSGVTAEPVGLGEIVRIGRRLSSVAADRELWERVVRPKSVARPQSEAGVVDWSPDASIVGAMNEDRGTVAIGWFVSFLVIYLVLVGPVNYLFFKRRGKRELLWISVPILALAFSGVAYGLARGARGDLEIRVAGAAFTTENGGSARVVVSASSGGSGERTFTFPGSTARSAGADFFGGASRGTVQPGNGETEVHFETSPFSVSAAVGRTDVEGFIDATARVERGAVSYDITNRTPFALDAVAVVRGSSVVEVGSLEPGARARADAASEIDRGFRPLLTGRLRNSLLTKARAAVGAARSLQAPLVVGLAYTYDPPVAIDGRDVSQDAKLLFVSPVRVEVDPGEDVIPPAAGTIDLVDIDGDIGTHAGGAMSIHNFDHAVFGYSLPAATPPGPSTTARVTIDAGGQRRMSLEVYDRERRLWVPQEGDGGGFPPVAELGPSSFFPNGSAYFRFVPQGRGFLDILSMDVEAKLR